MSRYSKFNSLNDYKNLSTMIKNSNKDDLSNLLTPSDTNTSKTTDNTSAIAASTTTGK